MISIKEIADLTGVSISTVSKIINNKSDDISQETINRVLDAVKKYNYTPYGLPRNSTQTRSLVIALILKRFLNASLFVKGVIQALNQEGYSLLLFDSSDSEETEKMNISKAISKNVDGVIWEPVSDNNISLLNELKNTNLKLVLINSPYKYENSYSIDFKEIGYLATQTLINAGHTRIACYNKHSSLKSVNFLLGYKQCLFNNNIQFNDDLVFYDNKPYLDNLKTKDFSAIVCSHYKITERIIEQLKKSNFSIPLDISIITSHDYVVDSTDIPNISIIRIPNFKFGEFIGNQIVSLCELKTGSSELFSYKPKIENYSTIDIPYDQRKPKIIVVGSINIDNILYLDEFPTPGKTKTASECILMPGGKGLNQAIGVSMLKKEVTLIGKVGKDPEGNFVCQSLASHNIDTTSVITAPNIKTGKAYIFINAVGDSTITVAKGANDNFYPTDITENAHLFENAKFCLLQSEIPMETVREAMKTAKKYGTKIIFKPSTIKKMENSDYKLVDIFVPNKNEALQLSGASTIEDSAKYFVSKGITTLIITLGKDGVYLETPKVKKYYDAPKVDVIDTTGASDAFISALSSKLLEDIDIDQAIKYAIIAAGFCISKFGVSNSLIDKDTLDRYFFQVNEK